MLDTSSFALLILAATAAGIIAIHSHALARVTRIPTPALFLAGACVSAAIIPGFHTPTQTHVEHIVTLSLIVVLFDGGLNIGARRMRTVAAPVLGLGVLGTFATTIAAAGLIHIVLGVNWYLCALVATAISPTDPAVVFSVLGQRDITGRSGTILEGESGANDPVGIALMAALLGAGSLTTGALVHAGVTFTLQLLVGGVIGILGARLLLATTRHIRIPAGLYPLRTLAGAGALFGIATLAHGSGFLAVFVAGILLGDEKTPYKREIAEFHSTLASLAELIAFAFLGFTVKLPLLTHTDVWGPGVVIGVGLAVLIRPLIGAGILLPAHLRRGERAFVLFAGLKGAVPLLLGTLLLPLPGGGRLYAIVVVIVLVSVVGQGGLVPLAARWGRVEMRAVARTPYTLGVRLADPHDGERRRVEEGSTLAGRTLGELAAHTNGAWVSAIVREGRLVAIRDETLLEVGDEVLVVSDKTADGARIEALFAGSLEDTDP